MTATIEEKVMPHNDEAEQLIIGAIIADNKQIDYINDFLLPDHFYHPVHSYLYQTINSLYDHGKLVTPVLLNNIISTNPLVIEAGGLAYVNNLVDLAFEVGIIKPYADLVYALAIRRGLVEISKEATAAALAIDTDITPQQQIEVLEGKLYQLAISGESGRPYQDFSQALKQAVSSAETSYKQIGDLSGISCGLRDLDKFLGGLHNSDLVIIAGRPSMGKTALATNVAFNVATNFLTKGDNSGVAFFSLEMSAEQLATRVIADHANVPSHLIRRGDINPQQFEEILRSSQYLQDIALFIDDTPAITVSTLRSRVRRLKRKQDIKLVMIDYLQLMRPPLGGRKTDSRVQDISEITQGLKAIAKEFNVPVIALSQLSRAVETREDKRPQLSDLRESGSIEQDADVVMFVYREEYYLERSEPDASTEKHVKWQDKLENARNKADIIIAKQRHGPIGTVQTYFNKDITKFSDLAV
jgi:replicative DNA helicase